VIIAVYTSSVISRAEAKAALLKSGYLLEQRVRSLLDARWHFVEQNVSYLDPATGKYREYDLRALRSESAGPRSGDLLMGSLAVECVNNPEPFVVLTQEQALAELNGDNLRIVGVPLWVELPNQQRAHIRDLLDLSDHRYTSGPFGTQFCSFTRKKGTKPEEWMASHDDFHFESISKVCVAIEQQSKQIAAVWREQRNSSVNLTFLYPVIVLQGELWEAYHTKRSVQLRARDTLQLQRTLIAPGKRMTYQIDVVRERALPELLDAIEADLGRASRTLRHRSDIVHRSAEAIRVAPEPADERDWETLLIG
jgi:hypothetical protein